jgi:ABC-2 type transport system permease protein
LPNFARILTVTQFRQPYFDFKGELSGGKAAEVLLNKGKILAVLDIPEHFQRNMQQGKRPPCNFR